MKTVAVIPCYNEADFIGDIVSRTLRYVNRVVVADDCSIDRTAEIARKQGADVYCNERRQGFGGNLIGGIHRALDSGAEHIVVTLDGDGQHKPEEIPRLISLIEKGEAELVIGSRFLNDYTCPTYRKFGIDVITWLYNFGCKQKITDGQSCLRAYWRGLFEAIRLEDKGFGFSTEVLIKARRLGYEIKEVPITCIYHDNWRLNSSMHPIKHGLNVVMATLRWRLTGK